MPKNQAKPPKADEKLKARMEQRAAEDAERKENVIGFGIKTQEEMLENWNALASGNCPPDFHLRLARAGRKMSAAAKIDAVNGSSMVVQAHLTALIMHLKSLIVTREDAIEMTPIIYKAVDSLTKLNGQVIDTMVDFANANKGIKAITGKMFVPQTESFQPGEIIAIEAPEPEPVPDPVANQS